MVFDVQWVLAGVTFLAVIVALFRETFWNWWNRPKIKLGLNDNWPYVVQLLEDGQIFFCFRLKVKNKGKSFAKNCYIKILSVISEKENSNKSLIEPDLLKWSSAPRDMNYRDDSPQLPPIHKECKNITPKNGWEFCDLFNIGGNGLTFASRRNDNLPIENYIVSIELFGDNLKPKKAKFKISLRKDDSFQKVTNTWIK